MDIDTSEAIETLRADLRQVEVTLSAKIDVMMRRSQVLYESLRDDIRMIAEGLVTSGPEGGVVSASHGHSVICGFCVRPPSEKSQLLTFRFKSWPDRPV